MEKKFDDYLEEAEEKGITITVKDLINYLQKFKPETELVLDKDGWDYHADLFDTANKDEIFEVLFQPYGDIIIIQN
jgi:hypothetical protein